MQENSGKFSMEEAMRLAQSPAGQQLLALLQQNNSKNLESAMNQAASGDYTQAKQILSMLMKDPKTRQLLQQLGGSHV